MTGKEFLNKPKVKVRGLNFLILSFSFVFCAFSLVFNAFAQDNKPSSIIVNGDTVEYSTDNKEVAASGQVEVVYQGSRLTCEKLTVNTQTKEAVAQGNVRLDDARGIIQGQKMTYNFETKKGTIIDGYFRANPYFGRGKKVEMVSEKEFIAENGYSTTCDLDHPHYRIKSKKANIFPEDKIQTRSNTLYIGDAPLLYLSRYNHSLKDPFMHVRLMPGHSKDWGSYLLSGWRYNLFNNASGRVYLDYRDKLGWAEGFGANYATSLIGKGDLKFYYTDEKPNRLSLGGDAREFQRYLLRLRHKWEIDKKTSFTSEIYKVGDKKRKIYDPQANFLKDYFYREFEKDSQPLSYGLLHRNFNYSSMDLLVQKRLNHWYDQLTKMPSITYSLPSLQLGQSRFYFENNSSFASLNKKATTPVVTSNEESTTRLDTTNKIFLPARLSFIELTPYVSSRQTLYDKGADSRSLPVRNVFYSGIDASTKLYRIFGLKKKILGIEINGLRHIITPTVGYAYNHSPTIAPYNLKQIDSVDAILKSNAASLRLSNKLQTKRGNQSVDLADFRISSNYIIHPDTGEKLGSNLSSVFFELDLLPYSWLKIDSDATYERSGNNSDENYNRFSAVNYDFNFGLGKDRSWGIGQRYQRKGGSEITSSFNWRFNPKWKISIYERLEHGHDYTLKRGLRQQEYVISRDLHCWTVDINYDVKRGQGETIWLVFKLKAFPETEFGFNQSYHEPKAGSQSNP
jgi:lipopolysaccharide export system protein LptA